MKSHTNSVNPLYIIFSKVNAYFREVNGSRYWRLVPTKERKEKINKKKTKKTVE